MATADPNEALTLIELAVRTHCGENVQAAVATVCAHIAALTAERDALLAEMMASFEASRQWRANQMPDEAAALKVMFEAWTRLKELGWRESMYCPRDGSSVEFIEAGSTGVHRGWRDDAYFWIDDGEQWPSKNGPILFRPRPSQDGADAKAIEARRAETAGLGAQHESAVREAHSPELPTPK